VFVAEHALREPQPVDPSTQYPPPVAVVVQTHGEPPLHDVKVAQVWPAHSWFDCAAARLTKLSITGATHTVPPTMAPALMTLRREIRDVAIPSMRFSSVIQAPSQAQASCVHVVLRSDDRPPLVAGSTS